MLFEFLLSLFPKSSERLRTELVAYGVSSEASRRRQDTDNIHRFEAQLFNNRLVIGVSNEHTNLVIGRCSVIEDRGMYNFVVKDYLSGEVYNVGGKLLLFTPQRLDALLKLDPSERCSLMYQNAFGYYRNYNLDNGNVLLTPEQVWIKLNQVDIMLEYLQEITDYAD